MVSVDFEQTKGERVGIQSKYKSRSQEIEVSWATGLGHAEAEFICRIEKVTQINCMSEDALSWIRG